MKKLIAFIFIFMLVLCGCAGKYESENPSPDEIEIMEGYEGISNIRMIYTDNSYYYDTGISVEGNIGGVIEIALNKTAEPFCVPVGENSANFSGENMMFKPCTSITKQIYVGGEGKIFRKLDSYGKDLGRYRFCYKVEGRHPNAAKDSVYIVMSNQRDINFEKITKYFFGSQVEDHMLDAYIVPIAITEDKWGLRLYIENETAESCTVVFEQLGGGPEGNLQTGDWYKLEKYTDGEWEDVPSEIPEEQRVWNDIAYNIEKNELSKFELNWKWLYGRLEPGTYRISKEVMDFKSPGNFEENVYTWQFVIE